MLSAPGPPAELAAPPTGLGRLAAPLHRLAETQGAWPPVLPRHVARPPAPSGLDAGRRAADGLVDAGADLVLVAGGGDATPALAVLAVLLGLEPVVAVGTSSVPGWTAQVAAVRAGLRAGRPHAADPVALLDAVGGQDVAGTAGLLAQCACRRTPVLLSASPVVLAGAMAAERLAPGTASWLLAGCSAAGAASVRALRELGLEPVLDLALDRPEGAELALALLVAAVPLTGPVRG